MITSPTAYLFSLLINYFIHEKLQLHLTQYHRTQETEEHLERKPQYKYYCQTFSQLQILRKVWRKRAHVKLGRYLSSMNKEMIKVVSFKRKKQIGKFKFHFNV